MDSKSWQGACLCEKIHFSLSSEPISIYGCWCKVCQHIASGSASINALVKAPAVSVSGQVSTFSRAADSGNTIIHHFCPDCGTQLFATDPQTPQYLVIRTGNFSEPAHWTPRNYIWEQNAPDWAK